MKTPYELESLGWKITQISNGDSGFTGCKNFNIFHSFFFPFGKECNNWTLTAVLEFIDNFIKEEQHKEDIERFNLDR